MKEKTLTLKGLDCYTCRKVLEGKDEEEDADTERSACYTCRKAVEPKAEEQDTETSRKEG